LYRVPDYPAGWWYVTLITPQAEKNVLDLGYELKSLPFAIYVSVEINTAQIPVQCD
jgi:hypothetical protein